jgi:two-component system, NarL family, nitrate/nitrite response regulator NarL
LHDDHVPICRDERPLAAGQVPRVVVASDVALVCESLCAQLERDPRIALVGSGPPDDATCRLLGRLRPDALILDFGSRDSHAFAERLRAFHLAMRLIGIAIDKSPLDVADWAKAGVSGFIDNDGTVDDVVRAVLGVARGDFCCSPRTAAAVVSGLIERPYRPRPDASAAQLTRRETEVLFDLERGASNKEIARRLGISAATVKNHVHHLLEKLRVTRRAQAAALVRSGHY